MNKTLNFVLAIMLLVGVSKLSAQTVEVEKTYEITGKSKRGFLSGVDYDGKSYQLTYITKQTDRKLQTEWYKFDNDFNFIQQGGEEETFEKMKTKYKWFKFKDLAYSIEGVTVANNLTGTLVLKRKRVSLTYNFWIGGYNRKVEILEKLKPKNGEDAKLTLVDYFEDNKSGDVVVFARPKAFGKKAAQLERPNDLIVMRFNKDLDVVSQSTIPFDQSQILMGSIAINGVDEEDPENPPLHSCVLVFANGEKDKFTDYTYLKVGANTKVVNRETFKSNVSAWKIDEFIYDDIDDELYIFGPCVEGTDKSPIVAASAEKFKALQIVKINHSGKVEYVSFTNLPEIASKLQTPPSQKKAPEYEGKKFSFANYYVTSKKELFIAGQNFRIDKAGNDAGTRSYLDAIGFHFDKAGKLISQYGVDIKETGIEAKKAGTPQSIFESSTGNLYWLVREIKDFNSIHNKLLTYPRMAKISNGKIGDFVTLGKSEGFYLDPKYPSLETEKGNKIVFFGSNKSGKNLWFCRVKID